MLICTSMYNNIHTPISTPSVHNIADKNKKECEPEKMGQSRIIRSNLVLVSWWVHPSPPASTGE